MKVTRVDSIDGRKLQVLGSEAWKISGADGSVVNILRRALMADVPVQAVDMVTFYKWDRVIESEMVAHRIGQLPVQGLEPMRFEIDVTAEARKPLTWVTTADITGPDAHRVVRGDVHGNFLIAPLLAGQRLHVVCQTALGTGRKDTKWHSTLPVLHHDEEGCTFIVETTGALKPVEAWMRCLHSSISLFQAIASQLRS